MKKSLRERTLISIMALTGAVALLAGCGKSDQEPPQPQVGTGGPPPLAAVEPAPAEPTILPQASMATPADADASLTTQVKTALLADPEMQALTINVDTRDGIVQLSGFVDSREQTEKAATIAAAVDGVRSVDNKLDLRTGSATSGPVTAGPVTDATITTQIKESLLADPYLNNIDVVVTTRNGEVQLSGFVPSQEQADDVLAAAHRAEGVKNVVSTLSVGGKVGQSEQAESR